MFRTCALLEKYINDPYFKLYVQRDYSLEDKTSGRVTNNTYHTGGFGLITPSCEYFDYRNYNRLWLEDLDTGFRKRVNGVIVDENPYVYKDWERIVKK